MVTAAVAAGHAFEGRRQVAIARGHQRRQPVDLLGYVCGCLDFDPLADSVKDGRRIERVGGGHWCVVALFGLTAIPVWQRRTAVWSTSSSKSKGQRFSDSSRAAICSTRSTMLRRSLASVRRVNARVRANPSEVARKSDT